ncbi:MAG: hypothetical protein HY665_01050 [Chloroflexi bacterium]|nr:hypothetical protein [Chloroflexota bacterium]
MDLPKIPECNPTGDCVHHWILDRNNDAVCKKCGTKKHFARIQNWYSSQYHGTKRK